MKRSQQKTEDTWDLQSVFQDEASWQEDYDRTLAAIVGLETYRGRMASSDDVLFEALCTLEKVALELEKVCTYASLSYECNAIDGAAQRMAGLASSLEARFQETTSYMDPELMSIDPQMLMTWMNQDRFSRFRNYIDRLMRMKEHTLSAAEERILALDSEAADACSSAFHDLNDIDLDFGSVRGTRLTHASYSVFMQDADEEVRKEAYMKLYGEYEAHRHVLARLYAGSVNQDIFLSRARGYSSSLEAALIGTPQVVCWSTSPLTYFVAKNVLRVGDHIRYISLGNLCIDRQAFRELIQEDFNIEEVLAEVRRLNEDQAYRSRMLADYAAIRESLGGSGASRKVAAAMIRELRAGGAR